MPPGKSKEDTWKTKDLEKSLKEAKDERRRHKDKDRDKDRERHRDKDHDKDRDRDHRKKDKDRHRDDDHKERRHRDKENDDRGHRDKPKHRDEEKRDKDRPRRDRDDREHRSDRRQRDERDVRTKSSNRKPKEDGERRKHRDKDDRHDDKDRRSKHRDETGRDHDKHRDKDDERRRHKDRDDGKRRHDQDEDKSRRHKDRDEDEERRKRHEERKERKWREEKEREEKEKLEKERLAKKKVEENGDDDYDDDFEDYDDDFEDEDGNNDDDNSSDDRDSESNDSSQPSNQGKKQFNGEMDEILDAMNKENERLLTESRRPQWSDEEEKTKRPVSKTKQTFINFVSAKQRQMSSKAMSKVARRGYELQELIEFDVSEYDIFDMPPLTEYTMYMRSFGSSNTKQAYVQTNEDNIDRELQTEDIEYSEKWTQQPPSEILACGGPDDKKTEETDESYKSTDMTHLSAFIERSAQVMTILIEEDFLETLESKHSRSKQSNIIISDAFTEITVPGFLKDRPIVYSHFSPVHTHMLLTLHATSGQPSSEPLTRQGCVCVWNVNEPTQPQKVLMCESQPSCCCFSPTKTNLAFAGMGDGSLVCWDTREPSAQHKYHKHEDTSWLLRYPTYNTAGVLHYENHQSPVTAISTIVAPGESASASLSGLSQSESSEGLSFQLASLEENGIVHLWVVAELSHPDLAGSDSDYGLAPGGKVKLVKSSAIQLDSPLRDTRLRTTMKCADMQLLPSNNSHYYVATDTGCVVHGLRYGGKAPPRAYRPLIENLVQVTSIDFSPFAEPVFLAGCEDGSLRLYHADTEWPIATWPLSTDSCPIRLVRWCRSRPAVFFVLDAESRLYIWDLQMDDSSPLKQEAISKHRVTSLALSNDYSATGLGLPGRRPQMVVCLDNGSCEIHTMNQQFSTLMADEVDQFAAFLQKNC